MKQKQNSLSVNCIGAMAEAKRKPIAKKRKVGKTDNSEVLDSSGTEVKRLASTVCHQTLFVPVFPYYVNIAALQALI